MKNFGSVMILYIVLCGHYSIGVKNKMVAKILF